MPLTRNEVLYLSAGIAIGALAGANFNKIRDALAPVLGAVGAQLGDSYAGIAQKVAEQVESLQDTLAEAGVKSDAA
ncbi:MAG: hypothetical protein K2Y37_08490 [Pirellulales bacterium]|nr:hypothetical protein [Pirellulales bacterium]